MLLKLCRHTSALWAWFALLPGSPANASTRTSTVSDYGVEVKAERLATTPDPTQTVSRISDRDLTRARVLGQGVESVVDSVAGVRVLDLGGPGRDQRLTIRGGTPAQTGVLVDGIRLSTPFATGLELGFVPLASLEEISVVRGGAGAALGGSSLTGALIVRTRRADEQPLLRTRLGYGSFNTLSLDGVASSEQLVVSLGYRQSDGDFPYVSSLSGLPDREDVRRNNDSRQGTVSLRHDIALGSGLFSTWVGGSVRESGVPGLETQPTESARELRSTARARVGWRREVSADRAGVQLGAQASYLGIDYEDPDAFLGASVESKTHFVSGGGDLELSTLAGDAHHLRGRVELDFELSDSTEYGQPGRVRSAVSVSDELAWTSWVLFFGLRGELLTGQNIGLLPRAGVRFEPESTLSVGLAAGRSWRVPTVDELYHPTESGLSGNPDLVPESAWEAELFCEYAPLSFLSFEVAGFARWLEQTILYVNRNAFEIRPENLGSAKALGAEASVALDQTWSSLRLSSALSGTLLLSELDTTGQALPTQAPAGANAQLAIEILPSAGLSHWELFTRARFASPTTANLSGTLETEAYLRWDVGLLLRPFETSVLSVLVTNLLDTRTLETVNKLPVPGRMVLASVEVQTE